MRQELSKGRLWVSMLLLLVLLGCFVAMPGTQASEASARDDSAQTQSAGGSTMFSEDFEGAFPGTAWTVSDDSINNDLDYWGKTNYNKHGGTSSGWCAEVGDQQVTVVGDDFEGTGGGARNDWDSANGEDYWDYTTYKKFGGSYSMWCAGIGSHSLKETVFYENFDGAWLDWANGDSNTASGVDCWGASTYKAYSVSTSAWCAQVGTQSSNGANNADVHLYDNDMHAYMFKPVSLGSYASSELRYWYWLDSESGYDYLKVIYLDGATWYYVDQHTGYSSGWQYSTVSIPTTATEVGFYFDSDDIAYGYEGAYVDNVTLVGTLPEAPNTSLHQYDNNQHSYMLWNVDLSSYSAASLSYFYWLSSESGFDYLKVIYYSEGSYYYIDPHTGVGAVWQESTVSIPTTATWVGLFFESDSIICNYEGAYVDNVRLVGVQNNNLAHQYDDYMHAYMYRSVSLSGYTFASLSYWYYLDCEPSDDYLEVMYNIGGTWIYVDQHTGDSGGWHYSTVSIPTTATEVGFRFHSDVIVHNYEGAYIDDIVCTATMAELLAVRGLDNGIYYRIYPGYWGSWYSLPGSTPSAPAAEVFQSKLHIVVQGMDGNSLWHGSIDLTTNFFSGWTQISGGTPSSPTLAASENKLCLVVRGMDDKVYFRFYDGTSWGVWNVWGYGGTSDSPAATVINDKLSIVVRGMDSNSLWHSILDISGPPVGVKGWTRISGATSSKPTLAGKESVNKLYLVVRGEDNGIYCREYDGAGDSWGTWTGLPGVTGDAPAATIYDNSDLDIVVRGMDGNSLWYGRVIGATLTFVGWYALSGSTPSPPTLAS